MVITCKCVLCKVCFVYRMGCNLRECFLSSWLLLAWWIMWVMMCDCVYFIYCVVVHTLSGVSNGCKKGLFVWLLLLPWFASWPSIWLSSSFIFCPESALGICEDGTPWGAKWPPSSASYWIKYMLLGIILLQKKKNII